MKVIETISFAEERERERKVDRPKVGVGIAVIQEGKILYLAHKLGIDPIKAAQQKIKKMGQKYPADLCRGKALKYTAYEAQS